MGYGGATKMMVFVAEGLAKLGHSVSIINLNTTGSFKRIPSNSISVKSAFIGYSGTICTNYKWIKFISESAKSFQSDILIGFLPIGNFGATLVGKLLHLPVIISERGDPSNTKDKSSLLARIKFRLINSAEGAVFQTKGASLFYSVELQSRCTIIPNPIFIDKVLPKINYNERPKTIVSLGRIANKQKRLDILLKSFSLFLKSHPDYILNIYGDGPDENLLKDLIFELNLEKSVFLKGVTKDPYKVFGHEGIYIITSDYEGISNSLLEAMAAGLPVVSTDHSPGGARLLITDHDNGLLAPVQDCKALAKALCEFADNPDLAEKCGNKAREVLTRFSPESVISKWDHYIKKIVMDYRK